MADVIAQLQQVLNRHERQFLLVTWQKLGGESGRQAQQVTTKIFERLVEKSAAVNQLFDYAVSIKNFGFGDDGRNIKHSMLQEHGRKLAEMINNVLEALNTGHAVGYDQDKVTNVRGIG